jgi:anti-sigma factor RsiW
MITRDNYEEFFLLYTDNELSEAERLAVERFVAEHPDLREEWEALLQCRVSPDSHLTFPDRNALLKPEIEGSAYTGTLLSYIDGELNEEERARIETVIREQPHIAIELAVLRQTVCHPDPAVVFMEKDRLYQPESNRKIIPLPWLRAGIAAAVAGTIALLLLLPSKRPADQLPPTAIASHDSPANTHKIIPAVTPEPVVALHPIEGQPSTHKDRPAKQIIQRREAPQARDVAADNSQEASLPATRSKVDPVRATDDANAFTTAAIGSMPPATDLAANVHPAVQTGIPKEQSSFATQALQEEAGDQRDNNFVTDESPAPGRTALRGIFRKLKRTLGKTAERDGDGNRQVLVGAFQVSLD